MLQYIHYITVSLLPEPLTVSLLPKPLTGLVT